MVYTTKREFTKAIEDFTQAVSLNRKCAAAYGGRAIVYSALAAQEIQKARSLTGDSASRSAFRPPRRRNTPRPRNLRMRSKRLTERKSLPAWKN